MAYTYKVHAQLFVSIQTEQYIMFSNIIAHSTNIVNLFLFPLAVIHKAAGWAGTGLLTFWLQNGRFNPTPLFKSTHNFTMVIFGLFELC